MQYFCVALQRSLSLSDSFDSSLLCFLVLRLFVISVYVNNCDKYLDFCDFFLFKLQNNDNTEMADFKIITSDFVNVQISTSKDDISLFNEKRFPKDITVLDLKGKLELMTGGSCATMRIEAYNKDNQLICSLTDDQALLGSYPIESGTRLHVVDNFALRSELDFGNVEKYEMQDDEYAKKSDSVRSFLVRNKMGQYNEEFQKKKEKQEQEEQTLAAATSVGARCKVTVKNAAARLGTVMYSGPVEGLAGFWIGVKYDEPLGKNNGSFKDKSYFECPQNYGAFVKPQNVLTGDFPEEEYDLNEEI